MLIVKKKYFVFITSLAILFIFISAIISYLIINRFDLTVLSAKKYYSEIIIFISIILELFIFIIFCLIYFNSSRVLKELEKVIEMTRYGNYDITKSLDKIDLLGERINQLFSNLFFYSEKKSLIISSLSNIINFCMENIKLNLLILDVEGLIIKCSKHFCDVNNIDMTEIVYQKFTIHSIDIDLKSIIFKVEGDKEPVLQEKIKFLINKINFIKNIIFYPVFNIKNKISNIICIIEDEKKDLDKIIKSIKKK